MFGGEPDQDEQQPDGTHRAHHGVGGAHPAGDGASVHRQHPYVRNGITTWVRGWERNGWMTAAKEPVKNVDLWQRLQASCARHQVEWFWVKGHSGIADNELADVL